MDRSIKTFQKLNRSSSHITWCARRWRKKGSTCHCDVSVKKRKTLKTF